MAQAIEGLNGCTAIAVLIMAFLGAAMWIGFNRMWETTERTTRDRVEEIGR
jgi:hypothetical protein